ncbi:RDD family protein [Neolewinella persica]|uniref:RDD family protein n=1 Tax=Neolewinella persica TaxID=70998 RepID=UPI0003678C25|nr:RDD family protein [Neolewinella persica]
MNDQNTPTEGPKNLASIRDRGIAFLLDRLFVLPFSLGAIYVLIYLKSLPLVLACIVAEAAYKPVLEAVYGYTLGKKVMKIKVISQHTHGPITWNQSFLRFTPWALAAYAAIFVMIRYFQTPGALELETIEQFLEFRVNHPLSNSFLIGMINSLWIFSVMWIFSDSQKRALHDRLGKTLVVKEVEASSQEPGARN